MINIRPVSDIRNKYPKIEEEVMSTGAPAFLRKNGYSSMVFMSLEQYSALTDGIELALDEADKAAAMSDVRYTADEVFSRVRKGIQGQNAL